jgi:hypothetical protein
MTPAELRAQALDLVHALEDEKLARLVEFAYRLLHEGHEPAPGDGLEQLLEERA